MRFGKYGIQTRITRPLADQSPRSDGYKNNGKKIESVVLKTVSTTDNNGQ